MSTSDVSQVIQAVRALPVFQRVPELQAVDLIASGRLLKFVEGEFLIRQGDQSDFALVSIDGVVDVLVESKYGLVHLASVPAPALVGEIGVFTNVPRTATIQAKSAVVAAMIGANELQRFGQTNPS